MKTDSKFNKFLEIFTIDGKIETYYLLLIELENINGILFFDMYSTKTIDILNYDELISNNNF